MSTFISYNYNTGYRSAKVLVNELRKIGNDPWWFPDAVSKRQVKAMVESSLSNCNSCILIWSSEILSNWQNYEANRIWFEFMNRTHTKDPTDMFVIFKDCRIKSNVLPLFDNSEYIDFDCIALDFPNLSFLEEHLPSMHPLVIKENKQPYFKKIDNFRPEQGIHSFVGEFKKVEIDNIINKHCWILIKDINGDLYIQQPRPTVSHQNRWFAANINLGPEIKEVILAAVGWKTNLILSKKVLSRSWGSIKCYELGKDYVEIDRIRFPATKKD
jgi:uncharacterized Fe-S cluster protein YjdI